ncbi:helix-turn-helix transcriptional regulator [Streptomyces canus]|uniref:helix-turn-helix transcriptional regulator n=1 Tax=Streptomyces canus TaxID=58343 RepID=UPI0027880E8D|nr:LuxR family transcriptional regulator [Streptomyces canus]MDQ0767033.1 DNA-binding CsgD family transcriptional regulator [Streptomyces canus]MDQ1065070.1 DNA-binding CsgD family transcriptional regulator [Streptomyces canus]
MLWLEGPADSGKSHLLTLAAEEAGAAGALILNGRGGDGLSPLAPLLDAFAPLSVSGVNDPGFPLRSMRWIDDRLRGFAQVRPLLVVLDDVQHCDSHSLLTIRTLTSRLLDLPVLWLLAARSHLDVPAALTLRRDLIGERAARLELSPWESEDVQLLVRNLLGRRAGEAEPYLPFLGGLPGAVVHLCSLLAAEYGLSGDPRTGRDMVTEAVVTRRMEQLTPSARDLVLTASALGAGVGVRHLCQILGRDETSLLRPLREVLAAGLMRAEQESLAFTHPRVRDAVAATLPSPVRLSLRRRSVDLRLSDGTSPIFLATEMAEIAEPGDERALSVLEDAAREVAPTAPTTAAAHLRRAMSLSRTMPSRRMRLAARLVPLLRETGEIDEARSLACDVLQAPPDAATHAQVCLELVRQGYVFPVPQTDAHLRRAFHHDDVPPPVKDQLLLALMLRRLLAGEAEETVRAAEGGLAHTPSAHPLSDMTQHTLRSMHAGRRQRWADALKCSEAVPAKATELNSTDGSALPEVVVSIAWRAALLALTGAGQAASELIESGLADAERSGRLTYLPLWRTARAGLLLDAGRPADAARELAAVMSGPRPPGASAAYEPAVACTRARTALHTGDDAELESCAAVADTYLAQDHPRLRGAGGWIALLTAECRNQVLTQDQLRAAAAHLRRGFLYTTCFDAGDVMLLVAAAIAAGHREVAAEAVAFAEERAQNNPGLPLFTAAAIHARGLFANDPGLLLDAAERHGDVRPLLQARALEDAGDNTAAVGGALPHYEKALSLYDAGGAERDRRRVRSKLRGLGARTLPVAGPVCSTPADTEWRGLTRSELGVVRLVAYGATNREAAQRLFVSPHTVNTHLRHAFEKLGVHSRAQLARLYAREVDTEAATA